MAVVKVAVPKLNITAHFTPRQAMRRRGVFREFQHTAPIIPATVLPVDCTGDGKVIALMDHNDAYGICGFAMANHVDGIWTFGQGKPGWKESVCDQDALLAQYLRVSGGDNGVDEAMMVGSGGAWRVGIAGNPAACIVDALDIDVANIPLAQFCIDNFYNVCMAWSVPDDFIKGFDTGTVWTNADTPNPMNGHYTPLADVRTDGLYRLFSWGTWCWVGPKFVASVQPQCFTAFSARQFDPATGLDSKNRHVTTQAKVWSSCGGNAIPASVINAFPPPGGVVPPPPPPPPPPPVGPTEAKVQAAVDVLFSRYRRVTKQMIDAAIQGAFR
jgi:hypothetical protein